MSGKYVGSSDSVAYVGEWAAPTDGFMKALELWAMYEAFTEAYDRTVCEGSRDGVAFPLTPRSRALSTRFAREAHRMMLVAALAHGLSDGEMSEARQYMMRRW